MKKITKITKITENKGNARIWIQNDVDVENHGFTNGAVFTKAYTDKTVKLKLTGLRRTKGNGVDADYKKKHGLPSDSSKVSTTDRGSTIDIGNKKVSEIADTNNVRGCYIPFELLVDRDSNLNSLVFRFNKAS